MSDKPWLRFWHEGVPQSIRYPEVALFKVLEEAAKYYPSHTAVIFYDRKITYRELNALSDRFAAALCGLGVEKGDRIALFLPNIPQFVIAYYGALKAGATVTAFSSLDREREVERQVNDAGVETIIVLDSLYPVVKKVWTRTRLKNVIVTGFTEYLPSAKAFLGSLLKKFPSTKVKREQGVYFFRKLLDSYQPKPPTIEINPEEDLALLQYTGGTTGTAKAVMLTHFNLLSNVVMFSAWIRGRPAEEIFLTVIPMSHIYGMTTSMNVPVYLASTMVLLPRPDPLEALKNIQKHRATIFCGVPILFSLIAGHRATSKYNLKSLRACISGAAPLTPKTQQKFMDLTGVLLVEGYGLTEASPVTHCNPLDPSMKTVKIGSIGSPMPDTDARIMDLKTGKKELKPGENGELAVKGPQVMLGYWKMPKETGRVLRNGWLYTGDIGKMDEDGYFYITDRKKDLIKYKGYNVYPRELEDVIYEHPAVKQCAVVGKPDPVAGEIPKAFIVLRENAKTTEEQIMDFVRERVASYKAIREVEFRQTLPASATGKILRRNLKEEEKLKMKHLLKNE